MFEAVVDEPFVGFASANMTGALRISESLAVSDKGALPRPNARALWLSNSSRPKPPVLNAPDCIQPCPGRRLSATTEPVTKPASGPLADMIGQACTGVDGNKVVGTIGSIELSTALADIVRVPTLLIVSDPPA